MLTRHTLTVIIAMVLGLGLLAAGCARRQGGSSGAIQMKGSDTMVNLGQRWAEAFMKEHPDIPVAVTGGGSGTGIAALIAGTTDIAASSRDMKPEEINQAKSKGIEPVEIEVGQDAIVVVVNKSNPVSRLTVSQLSDIYTGQITNWSQVGGPDLKMSVLSRDRNSGTHVYFLEHVLRKGNAEGPEEFGQDVLMMPSSQAIADEVNSNRAAIGYYGMGYYDKTKQKALAIASSENSTYVEPTPEAASSGEYPISRALYLYTNGEPKDRVRIFIDFTLSSEGQELVKKEGFVPVKGAQ